MDERGNTVEHLTADQSWRYLSSVPMARIVVTVREEIDVFPVTIATTANTIYFRTTEGTKLLELTVNSHVVVEADGFSDEDAWSVVARGVAEVLEHEREISVAESLGLHPWIPTPTTVWVAVRCESITGRYFARAGDAIEPD